MSNTARDPFKLDVYNKLVFKFFPFTNCSFKSENMCTMILFSPSLVKKCLCGRLMLSWYVQIYRSQN